MLMAREIDIRVACHQEPLWQELLGLRPQDWVPVQLPHVDKQLGALQDSVSADVAVLGGNVWYGERGGWE